MAFAARFRILDDSTPLGLAFALAALVLLGATGAFAADVVTGSPDITIEIGSTTTAVTADEDAAVDNQAGVVVLENLGPLSDEMEVIGLGLAANGDRLIAFETTVSLAGGVVARPGDIVRYDGASYSVEFDANAAGVPNGAATDAASIAPGGLLLSFDTTVDLAGLVVADEDLVRWDGSAFALVFDGSDEGLDASLDVDAAQDLGAGALLMSFDTTGEIGGIVFQDEDVMRFDGSGWSLEFDASVADADWASADLDAVLVPEPAAGTLLVAGVGLLVGLARRR